MNNLSSTKFYLQKTILSELSKKLNLNLQISDKWRRKKLFNFKTKQYIEIARSQKKAIKNHHQIQIQSMFPTWKKNPFLVSEKKKPESGAISQ